MKTGVERRQKRVFADNSMLEIVIEVHAIAAPHEAVDRLRAASRARSIFPRLPDGPECQGSDPIRTPSDTEACSNRPDYNE